MCKFHFYLVCSFHVGNKGSQVFFVTGLFTQKYQQDATVREYMIYIPQSYDGIEEIPLLMVFHGFGGLAQDMMYTADFRDLADRKNSYLCIHKVYHLRTNPIVIIGIRVLPVRTTRVFQMILDLSKDW